MADSVESLLSALLKKAEEVSPLRSSNVTIVIIMCAVLSKTGTDVSYIDPQFETAALGYAEKYDKLCRLSGRLYPIEDFADLQLIMPMISTLKDSHLATSSYRLNADHESRNGQKLKALPQSTNTSYSISELIQFEMTNKNSNTPGSKLGQNNLIMYTKEVLAICILFGIITYQVVMHACLSFASNCVFETQARAVRAMFGIRMSPDPKSNGEFVYNDVIIARIVGLMAIYISLHYFLFVHLLEHQSFARMLNPIKNLPSKFLCILKVIEQDATMSQRSLFANRTASQPQSHIVIIFSIVLLFNMCAEILSCIIG